MSNKKSIVFKDLSKNYGSKQALSKINLKLETGKIIGLLGPNGSGKTTLIKIMNGLLRDYQGTCLIDNQIPNEISKNLISYLPDEPYFQDWMKIKDALNIFRDHYADFDWALCMTLLNRLQLDPNMKIKNCSKGMKEKFQLALVMSRKAQFYILDEPLGGVDPAARDLILDIILKNYNENSCLLISTHLISDIEKIFDEVIFLKDGEVVLQKDCEELRNETGKSVDEAFREVFKC